MVNPINLGGDPGYTALGIGGLLEGINNGMQIANKSDLMRQQMANEAGYKNAVIQNTQEYHNAELARQQQVADQNAAHQKAMETILGGDPVKAQIFQRALLSGQMAPEQLNLLGTGIAGSVAKQKALGGALEAGYNPKQAQLGYATQKYETGSQAQTRQRVGEAVSPLVDQYRTQINNTEALSNSPDVNAAKAFAYAHMGKTDFTDLASKAKLIADEIQSMVGVGSNDKLRLIQSISDPAHTGKEQLLKNLDNVDSFLKSRVNAFGGNMGQNASLAAQYSQTGTHADGSRWGLNSSTNKWEQMK